VSRLPDLDGDESAELVDDRQLQLFGLAAELRRLDFPSRVEVPTRLEDLAVPVGRVVGLSVEEFLRLAAAERVVDVLELLLAVFRVASPPDSVADVFDLPCDLLRLSAAKARVADLVFGLF